MLVDLEISPTDFAVHEKATNRSGGKKNVTPIRILVPFFGDLARLLLTLCGCTCDNNSKIMITFIKKMKFGAILLKSVTKYKL